MEGIGLAIRLDSVANSGFPLSRKSDQGPLHLTRILILQEWGMGEVEDRRRPFVESRKTKILLSSRVDTTHEINQSWNTEARR